MISRYKGRQSVKAVEQDFPHFVEVVVPPGGLGKRLDAMYDFHARHSIQPKCGHGGTTRMAALFVGALPIQLAPAYRAQAIERARQLAPLLIEWKNARMSARQMAVQLTARGIPTPTGARWHAQTVIRMLDRAG